MGAVRPLNLKENIEGKRIIVRASLNTPLEHGKVTNAYRVRAALKTIEALCARGAKVVILAHIGREKTMSLEPVWEEIQKHTKLPIQFSNDIGHAEAQRAVDSLKNGEAVLLENVRRLAGEKENDPGLAKIYASYGDMFVNDAFADSHRTHASIVGIPRYIPSFAGPNFIEEMEGILPARTPQSPSVAIIGGAKFLTKEPLILQLLETYDKLFIGGALANDFLVAQGHEVGKSLVSHSEHVKPLLKNSKLIIPTDVVVEGPNGIEVKSVRDINPTESIFDVGPESLAALKPHLGKAKYILWNGPLGNFENGFKDATESLAKTIAETQGVSIVGGGDTVTAIHDLDINDRFTFVSTAGGAMLDFISNGTLAGIEALKQASV